MNLKNIISTLILTIITYVLADNKDFCEDHHYSLFAGLDCATYCINSPEWNDFKIDFKNSYPDFNIQFRNEEQACANYFTNVLYDDPDDSIDPQDIFADVSDCVNNPVWITQKRKFKLIYTDSKRENLACQNFIDTDNFIKLRNSSSLVLKHNEFSDWGISDEKSSFGFGIKCYSRYYTEIPGGKISTFQFIKDPNFVYPFLNFSYNYNANQNWKDDQGQCSNCWAWSAVASLEGAIWKATGKKVKLSVQQLTDCISNNKELESSCTCGNVENSFKYIQQFGLVLDKYYPKYSDKISSIGNCQYAANLDISVQKIAYRGSLNGNLYKDYVGIIKKVVSIPSGDDDALIQALHKYGPVAVAIDASSRIVHRYGSGIYAQNKDDCSNQAENLDHTVLLVGYGVDNNGNKYWQVRNQWGSTWGTDADGNECDDGQNLCGGYMYISRDIKNNCGISTDAFVPELYDANVNFIYNN